MAGIDVVYVMYNIGIPVPIIQTLVTEICSLAMDKNVCAGIIQNYIVSCPKDNYLHKLIIRDKYVVIYLGLFVFYSIYALLANL